MRYEFKEIDFKKALEMLTNKETRGDVYFYSIADADRGYCKAHEYRWCFGGSGLYCVVIEDTKFYIKVEVK